jgi:predicted site-specific integrase-resolvase
MSQLITLREVSRRTAVPEKTWRWWLNQGKCPIPFLKLPNGRLRFKESDLNSFLEFIERPAGTYGNSMR